MKTFSQFNIQATNNFIGTKLQTDDILDVEIIVHDFEIGPSNKKENTECLKLQIEVNNKNHVFFSGSKNLMKTIRQIPKDSFPFKTTIKKDYKTLLFT